MLNPVKEIHNLAGMAILFLLILILITVSIAFFRKNRFGNLSKFIALAGLILVHLQIVLGMILYLISPLGSNNFSAESMQHTISRFYLVEHPLGMILAAVLITIGYRKSKNTQFSDAKRHLQILVFYGMGFVLVAYLIPWFLWN